MTFVTPVAVLSGAPRSEVAYYATRGNRDAARRLLVANAEDAFVAEPKTLAEVEKVTRKLLTDAGLLPAQAAQLVAWLVQGPEPEP